MNKYLLNYIIIVLFLYKIQVNTFGVVNLIGIEIKLLTLINLIIFFYCFQIFYSTKRAKKKKTNFPGVRLLMLLIYAQLIIVSTR